MTDSKAISKFLSTETYTWRLTRIWKLSPCLYLVTSVQKTLLSPSKTCDTSSLALKRWQLNPPLWKECSLASPFLRHSLSLSPPSPRPPVNIQNHNLCSIYKNLVLQSTEWLK
jgi:hypothetical protein